MLLSRQKLNFNISWKARTLVYFVICFLLPVCVFFIIAGLEGIDLKDIYSIACSMKYEKLAMGLFVFLTGIFAFLLLTHSVFTRLEKIYSRVINSIEYSFQLGNAHSKKTDKKQSFFEYELVINAVRELERNVNIQKYKDHRMVQKIKEIMKRKEQFFAGMSHDLRTPLNSIIGFTDLLLNELDGPLSNAQKREIVSIAQQSEKLSVIIADVLDTSKLEAGHLEIDRGWLPSVEILTQSICASRRLIGNRPVDLQSEIQPGLPPVYLDKERIKQVLLSLVLRTVDSIDKGIITFKAGKTNPASSPSSMLIVEIIDTEGTVPYEDRVKFAEALKTDKDELPGTGMGGLGMGLLLARQIVRLHKGNLVAVKDFYQPVVFRVTLPIDD